MAWWATATNVTTAMASATLLPTSYDDDFVALGGKTPPPLPFRPPPTPRGLSTTTRGDVHSTQRARSSVPWDHTVGWTCAFVICSRVDPSWGD